MLLAALLIPFDLVKAVFYTADFEEMSRLAAAADSKASEYAGIWENMDDEAKSVVCKDDDETAFDTKKFKAAIKSGDLAADGVESINAIQRAIAEEKALRKKVKEIATVLEDKAKKKVESLSEDEINDLLERKWIAPIIAAINRVGEGVPMQFVTDFNALEKKYAKDADLLWIKNQGRFHPYFLYEYFFSPTFRTYLNSISHVGTIAHYTITQLSETSICLPDIEEQIKVGEYFDSLDRLITFHQRKYEKLVDTKKAFLEKLIGGEK